MACFMAFESRRMFRVGISMKVRMEANKRKDFEDRNSRFLLAADIVVVVLTIYEMRVNSPLVV